MLAHQEVLLKDFEHFLERFSEMTQKLGADQTCIKLVFEHQGKLPAIRLTKNLTGYGLKEAKQYVEALCENKYRVFV